MREKAEVKIKRDRLIDGILVYDGILKEGYFFLMRDNGNRLQAIERFWNWVSLILNRLTTIGRLPLISKRS